MQSFQIASDGEAYTFEIVTEDANDAFRCWQLLMQVANARFRPVADRFYAVAAEPPVVGVEFCLN